MFLWALLWQRLAGWIDVVSGADMHHPPSVTYPIGRTPPLRRVLVVLWLLGWVPCLWLIFGALTGATQAQAAMNLIVICGAALAATGCAQWRFWGQQRERQLHWDGADWFLLELDGGALDQMSAVGSATVRVDLQRCLLLRWRGRGDHKRRWLWADAGVDPQRWHLLRCALYSKTSGQGAQPKTDVIQRA